MAADVRPQQARTDRWWGAFIKKPAPNISAGYFKVAIIHLRTN